MKTGFYFTELIWENIISFLLNKKEHFHKLKLLKKKYKKLNRQKRKLQMWQTINFELEIETDLAKSKYLWLKNKRKK